MIEEVTYDLYELRGGSDSLKSTHLLQRVEAASVEDVLHHVEQISSPGERIWVVNVAGKLKPFVHIALKVYSSREL